MAVLRTIDISTLHIAKAEAPTIDTVTPLKPTELVTQALSLGLHPRINRLNYVFGTFSTSEGDVGLGKTRGYHGAEKKRLELAEKRGQPANPSIIQYHRDCVNTAAVVQNWAKSAEAEPEVAQAMQSKIAKRFGEPFLPIQKEFWNPSQQYRVTGTLVVTTDDERRSKGKMLAGTYEVSCDIGAYSPIGALMRFSAALFPRAWKLWPDLQNLTLEELDERREDSIEIQLVK